MGIDRPPSMCSAMQIAAAYGCQMVEGVLSHQMKQFVIDANKCVLNRPSSEARVEDGEFEENEVYAVDIVVSTGEGKTRVRSYPASSEPLLHAQTCQHAGTCRGVIAARAEHALHIDGLGWHVQVLDEKETAVYKRALEEQYKLKMKASRCALLGPLEVSSTKAAFAKLPVATSFHTWLTGLPAVEAQADDLRGAQRAAPN